MAPSFQTPFPSLLQFLILAISERSAVRDGGEGAGAGEANPAAVPLEQAAGAAREQREGQFIAAGGGDAAGVAGNKPGCAEDAGRAA